MQVVTGTEMQQLEENLFKTLGLAPLLVMENAGSRIVEALKNEFGPLAGQRIHILVGTGNNGGDGLVAARQLSVLGARIKVYLVGNQSRLSKENRTNFELLQKIGLDFQTVDPSKLSKLRFSLGLADLLLDAVLGTGFSGELKAELNTLVNVINELHCPVVSVDCPTGVNSNNGEVITTAVKADLTLNLGLMKAGCVFYPGKLYAGRNMVLDLGFPLPNLEVSRFLSGPDTLDLLPTREPWGHKGTFGRTLVVAGSRHYAGAAFLCGQAVLRGGGGMVTVAVPQEIYERFPPDELIVVPVSQTKAGTMGLASLPQLMELLEGKDVLAIGPGIGRHPEVVQVVQKLLQQWEGPTVIDADALLALEGEYLEGVCDEKRRNWVITPHPGEMGRLVCTNPAKVNADRLEVARRFAEKWGVVVALKGSPTIICDGTTMYINSSGNHGMATAGTGDVLTGLIAALLSQGLKPLQAGAVGVYVHGKAGDVAGTRGKRGLRASDCLNAMQEILL